MWVKRHVAVLLFSSGLTGRKQGQGTTDPAVFLHDGMDGSCDGFNEVPAMMTFIVILLFSFSLLYERCFFSWAKILIYYIASKEKNFRLESEG